MIDLEQKSIELKAYFEKYGLVVKEGWTLDAQYNGYPTLCFWITKPLETFATILDIEIIIKKKIREEIEIRIDPNYHNEMLYTNIRYIS